MQPGGEVDEQRTELVETIIKTNRTLAIATTALGECLAGGDKRMWGIPNVEFLDFNVLSAHAMASAIGSRAYFRSERAHKQVIKFDAMIIGTYLAAGVELFVTDDGAQSRLAKRARLKTLTLDDLWRPSPVEQQVAMLFRDD